jgi:hypothetical protein
VYEWVHVFECLLRAGQLGAIDLHSILFRPANTVEHRWADLARRRMRADFRRIQEGSPADLRSEYESLLEAYDQAGLPYERCLSRLGYAAWLLARREPAQAESVNKTTLSLARQYAMPVVEADAWSLAAALAGQREDGFHVETARQHAAALRQAAGLAGPARP